MKKLVLCLCTTLLGTTAALAGGIDRSGQSIGVLFEPGSYVEFSFASVNPKVSGTGIFVTPGAKSGDMAPSYSMFSVGLKMPVTDNIDFALIVDQPFGADVLYPASAYFAAAATATLSSTAITGIAKYRFDNRFSVYAGLRQQTMVASAVVPFVAGYTAAGTNDYGTGYLAGVAYERPEIAMRIALTYNSAIEHNLPTTETSALAPGGVTSTTTFETPQSINLAFQTGIAPKTLLFGGVRWVEWSKFAISPAHYKTLTGGASLVSFADDRFIYTLGLGRQITESWAVAASVSYEDQAGGFSSNLSPTDGKTSVGVAATYRLDNMKIQAGVSKTWIGDATTSVSGVPAGAFSGNTATAFGMKIGFSF